MSPCTGQQANNTTGNGINNSSTGSGRADNAKCDVFSKRSRATFSIVQDPPAAAISTGDSNEIIVEIATPGAREPIHFVEESTAFRGCSRRRDTESSRHRSFYSKSTSNIHASTSFITQQGPSAKDVSCHGSSKHHRRTSTPLDGVCFTLLGVSTGLKTPGVDHLAVARALVESSVDLRTRNVRGMTPLHLACAAAQVDVAKVLLLAGADSHARDHRSRCPLHMAALAGSQELVSALLTCGADPNKASDLGTTALHNAALLGRVEVSRALLVAGANPDTTDHNSFSPLYLAAQNGHTQVVLDLLAGGADPGIKTSRGFTALHVAARCGRLTVLKALLDAGVPVDYSSTPAETTPLHLSAGFSRESCVDELLRRGADSSRRNRRGATPLDLVGTLLPPSNKTAPNSESSRVSAALGKKAAVGKRVRAALMKAKQWQRRRGAVLLCETLRNRAANSWEAGPQGKGVTTGCLSDGRSKRSKRSMDCSTSKQACSRRESACGCCPGSAKGEGWVIEQLCTHTEPLLIRNVIGFL